MELLNSPFFFFGLGVLLGIYLGNSRVRKSVNDGIDKYILKKNKPKDEDKK